MKTFSPNADKHLHVSMLDHLKQVDSVLAEFNVGVLAFDPEGNMIWRSDSLKNLGYCDPHDKEGQCYQRTEEGSPSLCMDCPFHTGIKDGKFERTCVHTGTGAAKRYFEVTSVPLHDGEEVKTWVRLVQDVTERRKKIKQERNYEITQTLMDYTADAVLTTDDMLLIQSWNKGAHEMFGYTAEEVQKKPVTNLFALDSDTQDKFAKIQTEVNEKGNVRNERITMVSKEGRRLNVAITLTAIRTAEGESTGTSMIVRDFTHVARLEDSLSEKIDHLTKLDGINAVVRMAKTKEEIFDAVLVAVTAGEGLRFSRAFLFIVNKGQKVLAGNTAVGPANAAELLDGHRKQYYRSRSLQQIIIERSQQKDDRDVLVSQIVRQLRIPLDQADHPLIQCLDRRTPFLYNRRDTNEPLASQLANQLWTDQFVAVPLVWHDEKLGVIVADNLTTRQPITDEDVTFLAGFAERASSAMANLSLKDDLQGKVADLQEAWSQLDEQKKKAADQKRLAGLGEMAAKVAHEIRNPLVTIGGFAQMLIGKETTDPETRKGLGIIAEEVMRLEGILENVLGTARPIQPEFVNTKLNPILHRIATLLKNQAVNNDIEMAVHLQDPLPSIIIQKDQIEQVVINLMKNAIDATGPGGRVVLASKLKDNGKAIAITVKDTGVGIDREHLQQLWDPFFTTKSEGTGLGLHISKQIIDDHGGKITATSKPGKGTCFEVLLPLKPKVKEDEDA